MFAIARLTDWHEIGGYGGARYGDAYWTAWLAFRYRDGEDFGGVEYQCGLYGFCAESVELIAMFDDYVGHVTSLLLTIRGG